MSDLTESQRVERAYSAKRALEEFLDPAFIIVIGAYTERLEAIAASEPWSAAKITALANAARIAKEVHSQIASLVRDGEVARSNIDHAKRIEGLTPARKRLLSIG